MFQVGDILTVRVLQPCDERWLVNNGLQVRRQLTADSLRRLSDMPEAYLCENFGTSDLKEILRRNKDEEIAAVIEQYRKFGRIHKGSICHMRCDPPYTDRFLIVTREISKDDFRLCDGIDSEGQAWSGISKVDLEPIGQTDLVSKALEAIAGSVSK